MTLISTIEQLQDDPNKSNIFLNPYTKIKQNTELEGRKRTLKFRRWGGGTFYICIYRVGIGRICVKNSPPWKFLHGIWSFLCQNHDQLGADGGICETKI